MNLKNKRGITLIALVITIIVLLILAGVTIATLTGNNGILTRANEAQIETEKAKEDELRRLTALEAATNIENQPYTDKNGDTTTIPAGFAVSQVEGEKTIDDGLVVIDCKGNEFVWIPTEVNEMATKIEGIDENDNQNYQGIVTVDREPDTLSNYDDNQTYLDIIKEVLVETKTGTEEENTSKYSNINTFKN